MLDDKLSAIAINKGLPIQPVVPGPKTSIKAWAKTCGPKKDRIRRHRWLKMGFWSLVFYMEKTWKKKMEQHHYSNM